MRRKESSKDQSMKNNQSKIIEADTSLPSSEDLFYIEWGRETLKNSIKVLNGVLSQFITLDTALLAALIGFFNKIGANTWVKVLSGAFLMVSLVIALIGQIPTGKVIDLRMPLLIKEYKSGIIARKKLLMWLSFSTLLLSFLIIFSFIIFAAVPNN